MSLCHLANDRNEYNEWIIYESVLQSFLEILAIYLGLGIDLKAL